MRPMTVLAAALIPAFNCAAEIGQIVRGVRQHVPDVLVVDDGSGDDTVAMARAHGARVTVHDRNQGKGPALRTGLRALLGERWTHILMLDGDGQHDPGDIPGFLAAAEDADLVLGSRLHRPETIPPRRYWTNFIGTRALELMTGYPLEDSQCGYRLVAAPFMRRMGLVGNRYSVDTEILVRCGKLRARFAHVPVTVIYRPSITSHYRPLKDTFHIVFSAVRFKVDEGDLRVDPGPDAWRRLVPPPAILPALGEAS